MITARRTMGSNQMSNLANSSNMGPLPQVSGCTFVVNPSSAISTKVSLVAVQYSSSTKLFRRSNRSGKARSPFFPPWFLCRP
jgi:hypothetical protein